MIIESWLLALIYFNAENKKKIQQMQPTIKSEEFTKSKTGFNVLINLELFRVILNRQVIICLF